MTEDDALRVILPLQREDRKVLLAKLLEEMHSGDLEDVLSSHGFVTQDDK